MKKWFKRVSLVVAVVVLSFSVGFSAMASQSESGNKKQCTYKNSKESKKKCNIKDKQAWSQCSDVDCEIHAGMWDEYSVSDFYEI